MKINSLSGIDSIVKTYKTTVITVVAVAGIISVCSLVFANQAYRDSSARIYVLKDYGAEQVIDKRAQIKAHSEMFYHLFFEYDPSNFSDRIDKALNLIGNDGKLYRDRYAASGWFQKMQQNNLRFAVGIDSMKVTGQSYPYHVEVYGKQTILAEGGAKTNLLWSRFDVAKVSNSDLNPFGLLIEHFDLYNNTAYVPVKK